jgi:hypothetical protein
MQRYMQARASAIDIKRKKITCVPAVGAAQRKLQEEERNTSYVALCSPPHTKVRLIARRCVPLVSLSPSVPSSTL